MQDPQPEFVPVPGQADMLSPGICRILAPNPSPMTFRGTNTYMVGETELAVIDPGPADETHLQAILSAIGGRPVRYILVTHAHLDHSPLARALSAKVKAPVLAYGRSDAGRSAIMEQLAQSGLVGGGEGVDMGFAPDETLRDQDTITVDGHTLQALHTPGHMANHLSFALDDVLFSGDLVMGWATSLVSPPDGDLTAFMASLRMLADQSWQVFHPGHGAPVSDPHRRIRDLLTHRLSREAAIVAQLQNGPASVETLTRHIYTDVAPALLPAAARNVLAHLIDLHSRQRVSTDGVLSETSVFSLSPDGTD